MKKLVFLAIIGLCSMGMSLPDGAKMAKDRHNALLLADYVMRCTETYETKKLSNKDSSKVDEKNCSKILKEPLPDFLGKKGKVVVSSYNKTETKIKATPISKSVGDVLMERFGERMAGMLATFDKKTKTVTFSYKME